MATLGCPCGYAGDRIRACRCTPQQVARYAGALSGPLRDRIDLTVDVGPLPAATLENATAGEPSSEVRTRVIRARGRQRQRGQGTTLNSRLSAAHLARDCALPPAATRLLADVARRLGLSARGWDRARRVARTIADLADDDAITAEHVAESLLFRW